MNNDSTFIVISTLFIVTLISVCSALCLRKAEVDAVLKEDKYNVRGDKEIPTENNTHTLSVENHSGKPEMVESSSVDPEMLIDWSLLQTYSDHLGYWIGHFDFVISYISIPLCVSLIGHTFISKMYPDQFPNLKHYTFLGTLGSLPLNYKV